MWAISLLTIMLLPLLSAAPLNVASDVEDDNDGMHSHDENVTRSGKFFGHSQFDVGNINISGSVGGDDVSIGHEVKIDVYGHSHDDHHQEDDTVIECKEGLSVLFKSIDSNKNGLMDMNELLRVCHQNKIQIPESLAARISTIPDKTVGFNLTIFCELLKDCQSTNSADIISFLLQVFDKGFYGGGPTTTTVSHVLTTPLAVTCPYKDDLSSVLLVNNWRTQNQINEMSEEDKRNAVIAEVEQMTGHTTADLQRRDNTGDLGSLTSIANMAAFLIKSFIKSSSDVKAMKYKPDLRNTIIIETSQRCSIEVSTLQSKTDHQLLKTFFEEGGRCGQCNCGRTDAAPHVRGSRSHLEAFLPTPPITFPDYGEDYWGDWGDKERCPFPHFANKMELKIEEEQGSGDDTALNGIRLTCTDGSTITSSIAQWGSWGEVKKCPEGMIKRAMLRREKPGGDDTSANGIRFECTDGSSHKPGDGYWGSWSKKLRSCEDGSAVYGIQTRGEAPGGDDTALNDVRFFCATILPTANLKLIGGSEPREGNIFYKGKPVCDDHFGAKNGEVVCRELGFSGLERFTTNSHFGSVPADFSMDDVKCTGSESHLEDCPHTTNENCGASEGAGVVCKECTGKYNFGFEFPGNDIKPCSSNKKSTAEACQEFCKSVPGCVGWEWGYDGNNCCAKSKMDGKNTAESSRVSGLKYACPPGDLGDWISVIVKNFKKVRSDYYDLPGAGIDIILFELKMYNGKLTGLHNIHKIGTPCFDIMNDNTAKVTGQLKLDNLEFHYSARAGILCDVFKWCPEVSVDGKIESVTVYLVVEFGLTPGNEKPTIKKLWVGDIGDISVDSNVTSKIFMIDLLLGFLIEFIKGPLLKNLVKALVL